jgi:hypothetical protein
MLAGAVNVAPPAGLTIDTLGVMLAAVTVTTTGSDVVVAP